MKVANPVVRLHLVRERAHGGLRIRQWDTLADIRPGVHELYAGPAELEGVAEVLAEGHGFWRSCSGCYETEDGHPVGTYAYSSVLQCALGSGCSECGGLGATWDNTDYDLIAQKEGLNEAVAEGDAKAQPQPTGCDLLWGWFGLSYAAWLAIPRTLMHAMPDEWQRQMAVLLNQWDEAWDAGDLPATLITGVRNNRFVSWPRWLMDYRHPDQAEVEALRRKPVKLSDSEVSDD